MAGFDWGGYFLDEEVKDEQHGLSSAASKRAKGKSTGASIGGLLGGIIGQILIPIPGVGAAIGAGIGSLGGSAIGGKASGVSQSDLYKGNFMANTRDRVNTDIAKAEGQAVLKSAVSSFLGGINPASSLSKFGEGFKTGAGMGTTGIPGLQGGHALVGGKDMGAFMGGLQGGFGEILPSFGTSAVASSPAMGPMPSPEGPGPWANAPAYSGPSTPNNLLSMAIDGAKDEGILNPAKLGEMLARGEIEEEEYQYYLGEWNYSRGAQ